MSGTSAEKVRRLTVELDLRVEWRDRDRWVFCPEVRPFWMRTTDMVHVLQDMKAEHWKASG